MRETGLFKLIDKFVGVPLVLLGGLWMRWLGVFVGGTPHIKRGDKVLVVKLSALGDTLLLLPCLKALRKAVGPEGRIEFLCTAVNEAALHGLPWVDAVHVLKPRHLWGQMKGLRRHRLDLALDFDQWLRVTPLLCFLSGARRRAGFRTAGQQRHHLYHQSVRQSSEQHESLQFAALLRKAGCGAPVEDYAGFIAKEGLYGAKPWKRPAKGPVILHPGCGGKGWQREWPLERWAQLAQTFEGEVHLSGAGARETAMNHAIVHLSKGKAKMQATGHRLQNLVAQLLGSRLLVSGNTGVMHLAAGLGVPLVALHGPTDPVKWGPRALKGRGEVVRTNLGCSPCLFLGHDYGCDARPCMESIPLSLVRSACANA
jgi:heptosyltransferase-3